MTLAEVTIGWSSIAGVGGISLIVGAVVAVVMDKRRKDLVALYKGLYEGKESENHELEARIVRLEARLALFESNFMHEVSSGVADAIIKFVDGKR